MAPRLHWLLPVGLLMLAACSSDGATDPVIEPPLPLPPAVKITVSGDTVVKVGANVDLHVTLETTGTTPTITWAISDPSIAGMRTSRHIGATIPLVGRATGTVLVTATAGPSSAQYRVRVQDDRPVTPVTLGATMRGTLVNGVSDQRYRLDLAPGESVDIRFSPNGSNRESMSFVQTADGPPLSPALDKGVSELLGASAPVSGGYVFSVFGEYWRDSSTDYVAEGTFTFVIRRSGPVYNSFVRTNALGKATYQPGEAVPSDTLWILNRGVGVMHVGLSSSSPYVTLSRTDVVVTGHTEPFVAGGPPPAGAQPVAISYATYNEPGRPTAEIRVTLDTGTMVGGSTKIPVGKWYVDPRMQVVANLGFNGIALSPTGDIYGWAGSWLFKVDTVAGSSTVVTQAPNGDDIRRIGFGTDGSIYGVKRVYAPAGADMWKYVPATGKFTTLAGVKVTDFVVATDGTIYGIRDHNLIQVSASGAVTLLASPQASQIAYRAAEGALYYTVSGTVRRFVLATHADEYVFTYSPPQTSYDFLGIDPNGKFYVHRFDQNGTISVLSATGALQENMTPLNAVEGIGFSADRVYFSGTSPLWRMPLP